MSTFRPYGAGDLFDACNYTHCVPTGLIWTRARKELRSLDAGCLSLDGHRHGVAAAQA
ncbi:MAG: hypothetical protein V7641_4608 [Blastocatellia bacterium]